MDPPAGRPSGSRGRTRAASQNQQNSQSSSTGASSRATPPPLVAAPGEGAPLPPSSSGAQSIPTSHASSETTLSTVAVSTPGFGNLRSAIMDALKDPSIQALLAGASEQVSSHSSTQPSPEPSASSLQGQASSGMLGVEIPIFIIC